MPAFTFNWTLTGNLVRAKYFMDNLIGFVLNIDDAATTLKVYLVTSHHILFIM